LPFSDYCEILADDPVVKNALLEKALHDAELLKAWRIEIRSRRGEEELLPVGFKKRSSYLHHILDTAASLGSLQKQIHPSYKYDIKKALKSGLEIVEASSPEELKAYYCLYVETRRRHGLPPMPYKFFKNLWAVFKSNEMLTLLLAVSNKSVIAGLLLVRVKDTFYALSNASNVAHLSKRPNHLLWWKGIELCKHLGGNCLDFGRTALDNHGLLRFKRRWGVSEQTIIHLVLDLCEPCEGAGGMRERLIKGEAVKTICTHLPCWALELFSNLFYRQLG
jgi:hypothetical protein